MGEWLILLLLVPAIVAPVVLFFGFAGCSFDPRGLAPVPSLSAVAKSVSSITLTWTFSSPAMSFEFERKKLPDMTTASFEAAVSPFDDTGLEPATTYEYRVRAILTDGEPGVWSSTVSVATQPPESFAWTAEEVALARDEPGWEGFSLIQRIEAVRLVSTGTQVRLTLRASSVSSASIERIYISRPDPTPGRDSYDADADLTVVITAPVVVPANTSLTLPPVAYNLDAEQALLIAVDFSAAPLSGIRTTDRAAPGDPPHVPTDQASAFYKASLLEAPTRDRTGFIAIVGIHLVERIEVS